MLNPTTVTLLLIVGLASAQTEGDIGYEDGEGYDYYDESALANGPTFDVPIVNVTVVNGQTAMLPCSIDYLGKHKVAWLDQKSFPLTYDDRRVIDDSRFSVVRPSTKEWNLQIREVKSEDEGDYRCTINTDPVRSKVAVLHVRVAPTISETESSPDVIVLEGSEVELKCVANGIPEPDITWYKRHENTGRLCPISSTRTLSPASAADTRARRPVARGLRLTIANASRHCHDIYECEASNGVPPSARRETSITVEFAPEITMPASRMAQSRGRDTILECRITAYPQANNFWEKEGRRVVSSARHRIEAYDEGDNRLTLSLRINDINHQDYGDYHCVAANALGSDKQTIHLFEYLPVEGGESSLETSLTRRVQWQEYIIVTTPGYHDGHSHNHRKTDNMNRKLKHGNRPGVMEYTTFHKERVTYGVVQARPAASVGEIPHRVGDMTSGSQCYQRNLFNHILLITTVFHFFEQQHI